MPLADQVNTVERALGERMLRHAFTIMRSWVHELGLSFYMDRIQTIEDNYDQVFDYFLSADDPERDNCSTASPAKPIASPTRYMPISVCVADSRPRWWASIPRTRRA